MVTIDNISSFLKEYFDTNGCTPTLKQWTVRNGAPCNKETLLKAFGKYNDILKSLGYETFEYGKRRYNKNKILNNLKNEILKHRTSDYNILRHSDDILYRYVYKDLFGSYANAIIMCGITNNKMFMIKSFSDYMLEDEKEFLVNKEFGGKLNETQVEIISRCFEMNNKNFFRDDVCNLIGFRNVYNNFKKFSYLCVLCNKEIKTKTKMQTIAEDGHLCDSYSESIIDNFLYNNNVKHSTQVMYPNSKLKCDFNIENVFIEYTGFKNSFVKEKYASTLQIKKDICLNENLIFIEIDDTSKRSLEELLQRLQRVISVEAPCELLETPKDLYTTT